MKFIIIIQLFTIISAFGTTAYSQQNNISVEFTKSTMEEVLQVLQEKTNYEFLYNHEEIKNIPLISEEFKNASINQILDKCLLETNYNYKIVNKIIVITPDKKKKKTKGLKIKGKVVDKKGKPLPGAAVTIKGTTMGVSTDINGKFCIEVPKIKNTKLVVSFLGMKTKEILIKDKKELKITLLEKKQQIDEVVVTGYANIRKESFTGNSVTVKKEDILKVSSTNIVQALQTFDPSLRIQESNEWGSDPNKLPEFYIRGRSGIGIKELDKSQLSKSSLRNNPNLPTFIMDGFEVSVEKVYDFDPERIESVTILKDAAATAMYGSRAANGVIVITTKAPKPGKIKVSYNILGSITMPDLRDYNLMNPKEKLEAEKLAGLYDQKYPGDTKPIYEYNGKLTNIKRGVNTYWLSQPLKTSLNQKHSLYIEGGSKDLRFGVDAKYDLMDGVMKESSRNRMGAGFYLDYRINKLQIRNYISFNTMNASDSPYGKFSDYTYKLPYDEFLDENGNVLKRLRQWHTTSSPNLYKNPLYEAKLNNFSTNSYEELINNLSLNLYINDYLQTKAQFSVTKKNDRSDNFTDPLSGSYAAIEHSRMNEKGDLITSRSESVSWNFNALVMYNRSLGKHNINLTAGLNMVSNYFEHFNAHYRGFPNGELNSPNYAYDIVTKPSSSDNKSRLLGLISSLNYTYNNIYLLDLSYRLDGSSEFGSNKKFAPFWSGGIGLNLHNYNFLKNNPIINRLKLRATYGETGKVNFPPYAAQSTYECQMNSWYSTGYGVLLKYMGNEDLQWEKTISNDYGVNLELFNGLFILDASYYYKKTVDLITDVTIPSSAGFSVYKDNLGEVENKGFELIFRSNIINTKNWQFSVYGNLAHNDNKILKISDALKEYNDRVDQYYSGYGRESWNEKYSKPFTKYIEGGSLTSIFGMKSLGIDPASGRDMYLKKNGNISYKWDPKEQVIIGNAEADMQGAFGFNLRYKNFTLFTSFMYEFGGQRYNQTLVNKVENADIFNHNVDKRILTGRWQKPGDNAKYKDITDRENTSRPTSRFIMDYNVLSLNALTVGYEFDKKSLKRTGLSMLRFEVNSTDLLRISSVKAERGLFYPYAHTVNFSIKASF